MSNTEEFIRSRIALYSRYREEWTTEQGKELAENVVRTYEYQLRKLKESEDALLPDM
jgi:hypothetical protein